MLINKYRIFVLNRNPNSSIEDGSIYLVKSSWDDYGYKTSYFVLLDINGERLSLDQVKIGTTDDLDLDKFVRENECLPKSAFSLGQSEKYYQTLMRLDKNDRNLFYAAMMDIAYSRDIRERAVSTTVYLNSLIRFINYKTIVDVFAPMTRGFPPSESLSFSYSFPRSYNCDKSIEFNLDYEKDVTNSFAIIGSNGAGKTTFIKDLISNIFILDEKTSRVNFFTSEEQNLINSVINVSYTGFDDYSEFDAKIDNISKADERYPVYHSFNLDNVKSKLSVNFLNLLTSIDKIEKLKKYFDLFGESNFFENSLIEKINTLDVLTDLKYKSSVVNKILEQYEQLSSGQKFIFATVLQMTNAIVSRTIILIDEPENHMHPPLLSLFVNVLSLIAKDNDSMLIMATHSPIVLQEITSDKIFYIKRHGNFVTFDSPTYETYGSSYGMILNNVFGDELYKTGFYKKLKEYVDEGLSYEEILKKLKYKLGDYGKSLLIVLINNKDETY